MSDMDPARWARMESVFAEALERPSAQRADYIVEACGDDQALRRDVERMLAAHEGDPSYLEEPVARVADMAPGDGGVVPVEIGPYRVVRTLGRGGMGEVYLAIQAGEGFERPVALKVIRRGLDTEDVLRRFRLERRILAGLRHPHIAQLLEGGVTGDGRPYLVMEFVEGDPLDVFAHRHGLGVEARLRLFLTVCDAVQHAHQNLVLHRDLKPANILVTQDGTPKLMDFGIGKLLDPAQEEAGLTRTGMRLLTPEYAAPEQVRGEPVSTATDVYGLGVLLYRLLTDRSPYGEADRTPTELERAVLEVEPRRPSTIADQRRLAGDLDVIVLKALRKDPLRRYGSAAALAEDVRRHLDGRPVLARPDSFAYRAGKFVRRHRAPLAAAGVVLVALAASSVYTLEQSRRVAEERDRALEVRGFLLEMFGATAPDQTTGDTVTARQLLDRQATLLETGYPDPVLRAEMTAVLAEGYDRLGLLDEAEDLARRALDLRRSALGGRHPDVAASLGLLGWVLHRRGGSEEGAELLREGVAMWRATDLGAPGFARALNDLGVVREAMGEYEDAEAHYLEALAIRRDLFGDEHRAVATTASNLSVIRYRQGDFVGAVAAAAQALGAMRGALGPDHQRSIVIQSNLAAMRSAMGDDAGAEAEYRDLLQRQERLQGQEHPVTLRVAFSLGVTLLNQGRWPEAEPHFARVLEVQEAQLGPSHPEVGRTLTRLARVVFAQAREAEADTMMGRALDILRGSIGAAHPAYADALEFAADNAEARDPDRAEALRGEAVAILEARVGVENPTAALARLRLGEFLLRRDRSEAALRLLESAHAALSAAHPARHPDVHRSRVRLAQAAALTGDGVRADSLLREAETARRAGGATRPTEALLDTLLRRR